MKFDLNAKASFQKLSDIGDKLLEAMRDGIIQVMEKNGKEIVQAAVHHLKPIYDDAPFVPWVVTGNLKRSIAYEIDRENLRLIVFSRLSYSRLRHFVNSTHPTTVEYLSIPIQQQRRHLIVDLLGLLNRIDLDLD